MIALLAFLAVEQREFSREYLATLLWPDLAERPALANLRRTLSLLRSIFDNRCLTTHGDHIKLDSTSVGVDVNEFLSFASDGSWDAETELLESAASLYRGSFLEGFTLGNCVEFDRWQDTIRERLFLSFDALLSTLCGRFLDSGAPDLALPYAQRWLSLDPVNEAPHRALMEIHARSGRKNAALKQYETCTQILAAEGLELEEATRELHDAISENRLVLNRTGIDARERQADDRGHRPANDSTTESTNQRVAMGQRRLVPWIRRPFVLRVAAVLVIAVAITLGITLGPRLLRPEVSVSGVEVRLNGSRFSKIRGVLTNYGPARPRLGYSVLFLSDQSVVARREYVVYSGETSVGKNLDVTVEVDRETDIQRYAEENNVRIPPGNYSAALVVTEEWVTGRIESSDMASGGDLFFYSGTAADDAFEVMITYDGQIPLNAANPLKIYIGDITRHAGPAQGVDTRGWGTFTVTREGRYFLPVYDVSVPDDDDSGYFMFIVHDVGNDLADPFSTATGEVAGLYRAGTDDLDFGQLDVHTGAPVYPGRRYSVNFSVPEAPNPDEPGPDE